MGIFFSKKPKKPDRVTEQDKAILALKQQRDKLKQYQKKINLNLEKERQLAKQLIKNGKKDKAKMLLKKKRFQENLLVKTDNQLESIDQMVHSVEYAQMEVKVVDGLKEGNEALKKLNEVLELADVERIMEETKEGVEYQNEINALIGGAFTEEDEEDILAELEELNKDLELPSVPEHEPATIEDMLPEVPVDQPAAGKKEKTSDNERVAVAAS